MIYIYIANINHNFTIRIYKERHHSQDNRMLLRSFVKMILAAVLAGCGGGGSTPEPPAITPPPPPPPITKAEAFRFLNQSTFGATDAEADEVVRVRFETWIDDQMRAPMSFQLRS